MKNHKMDQRSRVLLVFACAYMAYNNRKEKNKGPRISSITEREKNSLLTISHSKHEIHDIVEPQTSGIPSKPKIVSMTLISIECLRTF